MLWYIQDLPVPPKGFSRDFRTAEDTQGMARERIGVPRDPQGTQNEFQGDSIPPPREPELHR